MVTDWFQTGGNARALSGGFVPFVTYFSHSYRRVDRDINLYVHDLCWEHGFALTVDPQSGSFSPTQLEMMMKGSACFVAVVTRRQEQETYRCSPFVIYECNLARLAGLPRLILVESRVSGSHLGDRDNIVVFDRSHLETARHKIVTHLERLAAASRSRLDVGDRVLGPVGLVLPDTAQYRLLRPRIEQVIAKAGYTPLLLDLRDIDVATAAAMLDELDFVIVEIGQDGPGAQLMPFVLGRCIPSLKLINLSLDDAGLPVTLPRLYVDRALDTVSSANELAIWWRNPDDLATELEKRIETLSVPRRAFRDLSEGQAYFRSLGHRRGPVFISNAGADNDLARALVDGLRSYNIRSFHYVFDNSIPPGEEWRPQLPRKLEESEVFMPLISQAYWQSQYCRREFDTAVDLHRRGRLRMVPCFVDFTDSPEIGIQGISLVGQDTDQRVHRVATYLDDELSQQVARPTPAGADALGLRPDQPMPTVDIAILTALEEEYEEIYRHLRDPQRVPGTHQVPNRHSWVTGDIPSETQGSYRVLLALGNTGTEEALLATRSMIDAFRPRTVLLVGVAGALDGTLTPGDVVVADRIVGYEYGKVSDGYHPRPELSFPTDQSVTAAARTLGTRDKNWSRSILVPPPEPRAAPRVLVGQVASGNKVIDSLDEAMFGRVTKMWPKLIAVEMEAIGSVRAVYEARERGGVGNFAMVRGISDRPVGGPPDGAQQTIQRDLWKRHAAAAAAGFTARLIATSWPWPPKV